MSNITRRLLWFLVSTAILAGLIYVSDYREIVDVLLGSDISYVGLAILSGLFTLFMWSVVWHLFFRLLDIEAEFRQSIRLLLAGTFLNAVTPLGRFGGEPFIAHLIANRSDASFSQALSSVSSADLSNSLPFLTFGTAGILYVAIFGTIGDILADAAIWVAVLGVAALLTVYLLWFGGFDSIFDELGRVVAFERGFGRLEPYIDSARAKGREILERMREVGDQPRGVAVSLGMSHVAVLGHIGAVYFALLAVGVDPVAHTVFLVVALSAFLTFSPTPGSVGTFEAGFAALLVAFFPVSVATATSIAIIYRVGTYLPGVVLGYLSFMSLGTVEAKNMSS